MPRSLLADAVDHNVWATLQLLDACASLTPEQLGTNVPGTYGSIIDTLRHLVGADRGYLALLGDGALPGIDEEDEAAMTVAELRGVMEADGPVWTAVLAGNPDPDRIVVRHRPDGSESHAPLGIRLAPVPQHGTDHRSQVCTALTSLGIEPPPIDVWDYASSQGRLNETAPTT
jgi:uncharacterized damage-inducible protein DinB